MSEKKNPIDEKDLAYYRVRCFESDCSSMIYMREEITVIKSEQSLPIQTAVASVLHRYNQVSPRLTSQSTVLINSIVTLNIVISDCTGCTFGLILFEKSLLFTKQNYCAAARNLFSP